MAYTKQTWNTGDVITAEKLNHIEDGLENAGGVLWVTILESETDLPYEYLDKTWSEITNAIKNGQPVFCRRVSEEPSNFFYSLNSCIQATYDGQVYRVAIAISSITYEDSFGNASEIPCYLYFSSDTADGVLTEGTNASE